ncbi:hypothetical protein DCO56_07430 [Sphingobacterium athyrii]|uniref:Uncharacterized protein n=1 Tax=Sphingobacterium athyrii TaxID=2152717 RepID=A0A363NVF1_9SPHI|nr:hypothetical protein DCO56_07430 [Sphingobacterium athyrii]
MVIAMKSLVYRIMIALFNWKHCRNIRNYQFGFYAKLVFWLVSFEKWMTRTIFWSKTCFSNVFFNDNLNIIISINNVKNI